MHAYKDLEKRRKLIRDFIRINPATTSAEIKDKLHTKVEMVYPNGMAGAFEDATISFPRTFKRMTTEEKKRKLIEYVKKNPFAGGQKIRGDTKINFLTLFKNTKDLFDAAGVEYPRKGINSLRFRDRNDLRKRVIHMLQEDPLIAIDAVGRALNTHPHSLFKDMKEIYRRAGLDYLSGHEKRRLKKRMRVVKFIKENPLATQRQINFSCGAHVQLLFEEGIFGAYHEAGVDYPFERLSLHGAALTEIKNRAILFESEIATKLTGYGNVHRLVKTKRGFADVILERKGVRTVIEIKNYLSHNISSSELNQLNRYLEDISSNLGFLICVKKPKRDTFLIGKNRIFVLQDSELRRIPEIMDKDL